MHSLNKIDSIYMFSWWYRQQYFYVVFWTCYLSSWELF